MPSNKNKNPHLSPAAHPSSAGALPAESTTKASAPRSTFAAGQNSSPTSSECLPNADSIPEAGAPVGVARRAKRLEVRARPRVRLGEALRQKGLDEHTIAEAYCKVVGTLTGRSGQGQEKVLVDVLDKCARVLEPVRPGERTDGGARVVVQLVHDVPRPAYEMPAPAAQLPEKKEESEK